MTPVPIWSRPAGDSNLRAPRDADDLANGAARPHPDHNRAGSPGKRPGQQGTPHRHRNGPDPRKPTGQGRIGGRVGLYAGFCLPGSLRGRGRRPSIYGRRCRRPLAVYPRAWAGRPLALAQGRRFRWPLLDLAPGGVYLAARVASGAGGLLHRRFTLTGCPLRPPAVCFLWHCPAGHPGWALPTTLPCGARTFLGGPGKSRNRRGRPAGSSAVRTS